MTKTEADLLQGTLDLLILKTLALAPMHGYGVSLRLQQISRDALRVQQGGVENGTGEGPALPELPASELANPERLVASKELEGRVREAVMQLPPKQQQVFVLRHFEDLPLKEIAAIQQTSLGAVKATLFQAVRKLRAALAEFRVQKET